MAKAVEPTSVGRPHAVAFLPPYTSVHPAAQHMNQNKQDRLGPFKIAGLILFAAPLLYLLFVTAFVSAPYLDDYMGGISFDSQRWKTWEQTEAQCCTRWRMVRSLTKRHDLVGMQRSEVIQLLGELGNERPGLLYYYLGMTGHGIDSGSLSLYLNEAGEVERYEVRSG